uniref:Rhodanese domain-containing protein n=1 Tax=Hyaloperonospora arabidopsidis (strain Emoy2) TaxID=559515 RepID=M4B4A7_HYAAE
MSSSTACLRCSALVNEVAALRAQNNELRARLETLEKSQEVDGKKQPEKNAVVEAVAETLTYSRFSKVELQRYGRQMLVKEFGVKGQLKLMSARVLLIGAGGLGSPAAIYLAAMGVGTLSVVDHDYVDRSNLHRQVLYDEQGAKTREKKVDAAKRRLQELNPLLRCEVYPIRFTAANALKLVEEHDVVVDASDNVATRYLVNDACALRRTPLVSGSALGMEGQVTVFTYQDDENATGCYRCLYPNPSTAAKSCAENGVLGVVPGVIGCLQAMETIKLISGVGEPLVGVQCFYDAYDGQFRHLKIAMKRNKDCRSCRKGADMFEKSDVASFDTSLLVEGRCTDGVKRVDNLGPEFRISAEEFAKVREKAKKEEQDAANGSYVLLDTRARIQFEMVHFPEAVNIPTVELMRQHAESISTLQVKRVNPTESPPVTSKPMFVICRRGVDSVKVTRWLVDHGIKNVFNINGGYTEYAKEGGVDPTFPMY